MRMNTQCITRALLVVALLSIFGMAMAVNVGNILELWNVRNNLSGSYIQTANINLIDTDPDNIVVFSADSTYAVGSIRKYTDGYAYYCKTVMTVAGGTQAPGNTTYWTKMWEASKGWKPIGYQTSTEYNHAFTGTYDGAGYKILNLYINRGADAQTNNTSPPLNGENNVGLFGFVSNRDGWNNDTIIKNLGIINPNITGKRGTGALVGKVMTPNGILIGKVYIINCYAQTDGGASSSATVKGFGATGGLVGANNSDRQWRVPVIRYCHAYVDVSSTHPNNQATNSGDNNNPYNIKYGGLVGCNENGVTEDSYARGNVIGGDRVGGLAGCTIGGAIFRSYATGNVTQNISSTTETPWQGGFGRLVGLSLGRLPPILGGTNAAGSCENCYYLSTSAISPTTGNNTTGAGLTAENFTVSSNFANWDFTNIWKIDAANNNNYPYYRGSSSATHHYRSNAATGGIWSQANGWQIYKNETSNWETATNPPTAYNSLSITVLNGHTMTVDADVIIDQTTVESGGKIIVSNGQTLTVRDGEGTDLLVHGTLEHQSGSTLNLSGELDISGTHTIESSANLNYRGNSKKEYSGTTAQTATNFPASVYDLILNNPAGVTFNNSFSVNGIMSLLKGSYTMSSGSPDVNGYYSPEVSYFNMSKNNNFLTAGFDISTNADQTDSRYIKRQWTLTGNVDNGTEANRTKTLTFFWTPDDDYGFSWGNIAPNVYIDTGTGTGITGYPVSASSLSTNPRWVQFDHEFPQEAPQAPVDFKIGLDAGQTLPVELSSFTAQPYQGNSVMIQWCTQSETNVLGFSIYRGLDDDLTAALRLDRTIPATNTSQPKTYVYYDRDVQAGHYYYWLESSDYDGSSQLFGPVNLHFGEGDEDSPELTPLPGFRDIYPNPFNPEASIRYGVDKGGLVEIKIYNQRGQVVRNLVNSEHTKGWYKMIWDGKNDLGNNVATGVYFARMDLGGKKYLRKMVMMK